MLMPQPVLETLDGLIALLVLSLKKLPLAIMIITIHAFLK
jgi:hypothetical protein